MKRLLSIAVFAVILSAGMSSCAAPSDPVRDAIKKYFPTQYDKAVAVAKCESGLNPKAISSGGGNWGLFQINKIHAYRLTAMGLPWEKILDPYVNAKVARQIYNEVGWRAWGCA